ncbi:MAG: type 1 glutamine amidotransferase [Casimicrobium sp.]
MRILILQNDIDDDAAHFATFLRARRVAFDAILVSDGKTVPATLAHYDGLAILGGPNSVNDDDAALRHVETLIREADVSDKPVLGHCLGGQLIATALGARVTKNPEPEVGWSRVELNDGDLARQWFGEFAGKTCNAFQWHYETFSLPSGATLIARNNVCEHQAFAYKNMLAMQFHIEVDSTKLKRWATTSDAELLPQSHVATIQIGSVFGEKTPIALPESNALANRIYARFLSLAQRRERS